VCVDEHPLLADIEKLIAAKLPREAIAGFVSNPHYNSEPIQGKNRPKTGGDQRTSRSGGKSAVRTVVGGQKSGGKKPGSGRSAKRDR
jgi:ATP-dependent RNA helicase RhlE